MFIGDDRSFDGPYLGKGDDRPVVWRYDEINDEPVDYGVSFMDSLDRLRRTPYGEIG